MSRISFPTANEAQVSRYTWEAGFSYPDGFSRELRELFPEAKDLHRALSRADRGMVNSLLGAYQASLTSITPEQVIEADANQRLGELVDRARQAVAFKELLADLRERYLL